MLGFVIGLSALGAGPVIGLYVSGLLGLGRLAGMLLTIVMSFGIFWVALLTFRRFRKKR